jgi:hypothetical protein
MPAATYVYCVIHCARKPPVVRAPVGLAGADAPQLSEIDTHTWLVHASAPLDRYGPGALEESLRDFEWVSATAVAHETVVEHFAQRRGVTVIPMKLFTMFSSPARAIAEMRRRRRRLASLFAKLRGCEEWGVRILRGAPRPPGRTAARPASGAAFLAARKRARDESLDALRASAEAADDAYARLSEIADDHRRRQVEAAGVAPPLLDAAFLVPVRRRARFRAIAARAARQVTEQGGQLTVTGPWPAYNFVSVSEEPA